MVLLTDKQNDNQKDKLKKVKQTPNPTNGAQSMTSFAKIRICSVNVVGITDDS